MVMTTSEADITVTVDDADALVNTDLAYAPGPGAIGVWLASTVADSRATISIGNKVVKNDSIISKVATNAQIDQIAESPTIVPVRGGEKIRVNLNVVSAATIRAKCVYMGV